MALTVPVYISFIGKTYDLYVDLERQYEHDQYNTFQNIVFSNKDGTLASSPSANYTLVQIKEANDNKQPTFMATFPNGSPALISDLMVTGEMQIMYFFSWRISADEKLANSKVIMNMTGYNNNTSGQEVAARIDLLFDISSITAGNKDTHMPSGLLVIN